MEKINLEKEKKIEEDNNIEKKTENFGNKFAKNVLTLIIAQILVKVLGLIYRVVIVNVPGFRKCRKPDIMLQDMKYMHLCLHFQV
ncbi:MAG: hypothetical protein HG454_000650 [Clostridiales bacterium]|nr:hypothetical protein [Clostridiales bacterium]